MAKRKGGKGVVAKAMEALQELFLTVLLPDRRLKVLEQQPLQVRAGAAAAGLPAVKAGKAGGGRAAGGRAWGGPAQQRARGAPP
jgi:hypothetical protein